MPPVDTGNARSRQPIPFSAGESLPVDPSVWRQYRAFEPLHEGFIVLDAEGYIVYLNPAAASLLNQPREQMLGSRIGGSAYSWPEEIAAELHEAVRTQTVREFHVSAPGRRGLLQGRAEPTDDGAYLYLRDIISGRSIGETVENMQDGFVLLDRSGNYVYVNQRAAQMDGRSPADLIGTNAWEMYPWSQSGPIYEAVHAVFETRQPVHREMFAPAIGKRLEMSFYPQGEHIAIFSRDITEIRRAQEQLRESEQKFALLFEKAAIPTSFVRFPEATIVTINEEFERLFGYSQQEVAGKTTLELGIHPNTLTRQSALTELQEQGIVRNLEVTLFNRYGEKRTVLANITVVTLSDGQYLLSTLQDITDRRRAEQALQERVAEIETLLETIPAAVLTATDPECRRITGNRTSYEMLRMPQQSNISKSAPPEEFPTAYRAFVDGREIEAHEYPMQRAAAEGREIRDVEETLVFEDGTRREIYGNASPLFDAAGKVRGAVAAFVDITALKEVEEALRRSEALYRTLGEAAPDFVWVIDAAGRALYVNRRWQEYTGMTLEEFNATGWQMVNHPDDQPMLAARWAEAMQQGEPFEAEFRYRRQDGIFRWFWGRGVPLKDAQGQVLQWVGTSTDITERKESEEAARQLAIIVEGTSDFVGMSDADGNIHYINRAGRRMLGIADDTDVTTLTHASLCPPWVYERTVREWMPTALQNGSVTGEGALLTLTGQEIPVSFVMQIHRGETGQISGYSTIARDITEQKERQAEIERLNERLRRSVQETHHRVKNNLQVISALVEMQAMQEMESVPRDELMRLRQHILSLATIHDLLTQQAKGEGGVHVLSVKEALEKLFPMLEAMLQDRSITFDVENALLSVRRVTTLCILVNELVSNAVKHGEGNIGVRFMHNGREAELEVTDEGSGFPDDFSPETAAHSGLDLIESLTRYDLFGKVSYRSRPEGGGQVTLRFPLTATTRPGEP